MFGSGVELTAITQVTNSSSSAIASEPSDHGSSARPGRTLQRCSVERVSAHPWTRAMFSVRMLFQIGRCGPER